MDSFNLLFWNVRGLNYGRARRDAVRELVDEERVSLLCLQETKLDVIDDNLIRGMLGMAFDYCYLPANHTRGGILVAWRSDTWTASHATRRTYSLTLRLQSGGLATSWWLTTGYGPQEDNKKVAFLQELRVTRLACLGLGSSVEILT